MKAVIVINYASEEDIGKKTSIHLLNEENEWVEDVVIKRLPQRYDEDLMREQKGWNRCLDEILGETE